MRNFVPILAVTIAALTFTGCGDDDGATGDITAPTVLSTIPGDGATAFSLNHPVSISFSESMDEASLDSIFEIQL